MRAARKSAAKFLQVERQSFGGAPQRIFDGLALGVKARKIGGVHVIATFCLML
jgi:hypothetical protein